MKGGANSTDIIQFIKGLSSSEKSYYIKMAKRHSEQNSSLHLKLFRLIDESKNPNDDSIFKSLGIDNKIHFSGLKNYLYKDILNTIVFKEKNNSVDTQLYFLQEQIRMLHEKGLVFLAGKLCVKAIALAEKFEKYDVLTELLHLQNRVLEFRNYKMFKRNAESAFSVLEETLEAQKLYVQNKLIYEKVHLIVSHSWLPISPEELVEIKNAKSLLKKWNPGKCKNPLICLLYFNTLAICQYMLHENALCADTCEKMYRLWNSNKHLINENAALFIDSFNTNCYNDFIFKNIPDTVKDANAFKQLKEGHLKNEFYTKHFEIILFNTDLKVYLKTARYREVKTLIERDAQTIISFSSQILSPAEQLSILSSVCISYFILEQWADSEKLLNVIKLQNQYVKREDILYFSLLFHLLILYEQKELFRLDCAMEAAYHFLYSRKKNRPFERKLMLLLKRLPATFSRKNNKKLITRFLAQLETLKNDPETNLYFLYFNYYGWLESKIMGISYKDYVSRKVKESSLHAAPKKNKKLSTKEK
jgi:hypothetical protein